MKEINKWNRKVIEDLLLDEKLIEFVCRFHGIKPKLIKRHFIIDGKEIDGIIVGEKEGLYNPFKKYKRYIGFELKLQFNQLIKGLVQSLERRKNFHWFYYVTNLGKFSFGEFLKWALSEKVYDKERRKEYSTLEIFMREGIGWINRLDGELILVFPSRFNRIGLEKYWEEWIKCESS